MKVVDWKGLTVEYYLSGVCVVKVKGRPIFNTPSVNDTVVIDKLSYSIREVIFDFDRYKIRVDLMERS